MLCSIHFDLHVRPNSRRHEVKRPNAKTIIVNVRVVVHTNQDRTGKAGYTESQKTEARTRTRTTILWSRRGAHPQVLHHHLLLVVVGRRLPHEPAAELRAVVAQEYVFVREVLGH